MEKQLIENNVMSFAGMFLKELPDGFTVCGTLDLTDSLFESLPNNMLIYNDLIIGNAKLKNLPSNLMIGGNLIMTDTSLPIPADIVIGGTINNLGNIMEPPFQKEHMIITDDNKRITFKRKKVCYSENFIANDYYYPEVIYYYGVNPSSSAIEFTEEKRYIFSCSSPRDGFKKIDWQRAKDFGIEKYTGYNIDEYRTVEELKEIYQTCTGACDSGIVKFKDIFKIDDSSLYTIRQLANMVAELDWVRGSVIIFFEFFGLKHPKIKEEA